MLAAARGVITSADASLFQQSSGRIRRNLDDFVVAVAAGQQVGCAALQHHTRTNTENLSVAVDPDAHGRGVGAMLVRACMTEAASAGALTPP